MSKTVQTLNENECELLIAAAYGHNEGRKSQRDAIRNLAMVLTLLDGGLRVGELCKLTRAEILFEGTISRALTIPAAISKNKTERTIPISERLRAAFEKLYTAIWLFDGGVSTAYAFYGSDPDKQLTERQAQRIIQKLGFDSLKRKIHPHILRHTFATRLMKITSIRVVQKLLGHKSISSTQVYTHPNDQDLTEAINQLNN